MFNTKFNQQWQKAICDEQTIEYIGRLTLEFNCDIDKPVMVKTVKTVHSLTDVTCFEILDNMKSNAWLYRYKEVIKNNNNIVEGVITLSVFHQPEFKLQQCNHIMTKGLFNNIITLLDMCKTTFKELFTTDCVTLFIIEHNRDLYWSYSTDYKIRLLTVSEIVSLCKDSFTAVLKQSDT